MLLMILMEKKLLEPFTKDNCKNKSKSVSNWKSYHDLSNYAIKTDFKNAVPVDPSYFAKRTDLATLKSDVDKLDIDKSKNVPNGLKSLKSKVDKWDTRKLETPLFDLSKQVM